MSDFRIEIDTLIGIFPNYQIEITFYPREDETVEHNYTQSVDGTNNVLTYAVIEGDGEPLKVMSQFTAANDTTKVKVVANGADAEEDLPDL